ncbi:MAG: hypothetical protein RLN76_12410 [Phycisphaeraceae bacterium]
MSVVRPLTAMVLSAGMLLSAGCVMSPAATGQGRSGHATGQPIQIASVAMKPGQAIDVELDPAQAGLSKSQRTIETDASRKGTIILKGVRESTWVQGGDGGWALAEDVDHAEKVRLEYEPALGVVPAELSPGQQLKAEGRVRILRLEDGSQREAGSYTSVLTVEPTASGFTLKEERTLDLNLATVDINLETVYDGRNGFINQITLVKTSVFGVGGNAEKKVIRRVD